MPSAPIIYLTRVTYCRTQQNGIALEIRCGDLELVKSTLRAARDATAEWRSTFLGQVHEQAPERADQHEKGADDKQPYSEYFVLLQRGQEKQAADEEADIAKKAEGKGVSSHIPSPRLERGYSRCFSLSIMPPRKRNARVPRRFPRCLGTAPEDRSCATEWSRKSPPGPPLPAGRRRRRSAPCPRLAAKSVARPAGKRPSRPALVLLKTMN